MAEKWGVEAALDSLFSMEKYRSRLRNMRVFESTSITVEFNDLFRVSPDFPYALVERPEEHIDLLRTAALNKLLIEDAEYAEKLRKQGLRIEPRIVDLPSTTAIRSLKSHLLGTLIMIEGMVTRVTPVQPLLSKATFICSACGWETEVIQRGQLIEGPVDCPRCKRRGALQIVEGESEFVDSQILRVQERFEELPPGQIPRCIEVVAVGSDLIDVARPGDRVRVVGILRAQSQRPPRVGRSRAFRMIMEANSIVPVSREFESIEITPDEERQILEIARAPDAYQRLVESIAPNIYGWDHVKEAILLQLAGGVPRNLPDIRIRGEINVLLIGDPGTAKTQMLKFAAQTSPRGLYASGRGVSAAGLTAAVVKGEDGEMMLEAGVVVLTDRGLASIDEIEKMKSEDRIALHEAMEQQTVTVAKGGIVATLNARTAILAAANPTFGRYDPYKSPIENIPLPATILSRFDLIFVMRDEPSDLEDARLSGHILTVHKTGGSAPPIPINLLKKYIAYARRIEPRLTDEAIFAINKYFLEMRNAQKKIGEQQQTSVPIAITPRQLESLVRLTLAHARVLLKQEADAGDAEAAIKLMERSLREVGYDPSTGKLDVDAIMTGKTRSVWDRYSAVYAIIKELVKEGGGQASEKEVRARAKNILGDENEVEKVLGFLSRSGKILFPRKGIVTAA
ncbi:MAG: minichromosome maintenance protein MCM [Thermofilaceae archaeon]